MFLSEPVSRQSSSTRARRSRVDASLLLALLTTMIVVAYGAGCASITSQSSRQVREQTRERRVTANNAMTGNSADKSTMPDINEANPPPPPSPFYAALEISLKGRKQRLESVCNISDAVSRRVLEDYGAMFLAHEDVLPPPVCMFTNEDDVERFQAEAGPKAATIGGTTIELQPAAMNALLAAREEALKAGLDITPRGDEEAARRSYGDTQRLWNTRFLPALTHWNKLGRLSKEQVARLRGLPLKDQVREVLELEKDGIFFSRDFSKSILYSIAAPGTSQHIAMLALDVDQFGDARVRRILARYGWFQTVKSDMPHFTFLGLQEKELAARGLRSVVIGNQLFWIPNVGVE